MNELTLNNGKTVPSRGFGTWRLSKDTAAHTVEAAIRAGYRHIDCAMIYGNEKEVGEGIKSAIDQNIVKREDLFITSKLWNTDHAPKRVEEATRSTLGDLGLDYLDLYLVHWGVAFESGGDLEPLDDSGLAKFSFVPLQDTWHAMERLAEKGLVKSIGVANYNATMLLDLLSYAKVKPAMNQIELHPYHAQDTLVKFCHHQEVAVTAYSPFGSTGAIILNDAILKSLADKYTRTPAQIVLRWEMQRGIASIPRTSSDDRIIENFAVSDFELSDEDIAKIDSLDQSKRFVNPIEWWGFPYF
jgi:diketogulonate reductase-like aldo/keto reductase